MKTSVSDLLAGDFCVMPQFIVCIEYVISLMISSPSQTHSGGRSNLHLLEFVCLSFSVC